MLSNQIAYDPGFEEIEIIDEPAPPPKPQAVTTHRPRPAGQEERKAGAPPQVSAAAVEIDRKVYTHMRCPVCKKRMQFVPMHTGKRYTPLAVCTHCGTQWEI